MASLEEAKPSGLIRKPQHDEFPLIESDFNQRNDVTEACDTPTSYGTIHNSGNANIEGSPGAGVVSDARPPPPNMNEMPSEQANTAPVDQHMTGSVFLLTSLAAIGGLLFGYDTGVVSGALLLLKYDFNLSSTWQELIVSVTVGGAAIFSLVAGSVTERWGRKPPVLVASVLFIIGSVLLGAAANVGTLMVGRILVGMGIGFVSVTVPIYIAECAPMHLRGRLVTVFQLNITFGLLLAGIIAGAFSYDHTNGWRYMFGLGAVPACVQFLGFLFMPESPRWLVSKERLDEARMVLRSIRQSPDVEGELADIQCSMDEAKFMKDKTGNSSTFIQMLKVSHVRRALFIGCSMMMFQQICGINTVVYYSATIIQMSGVSDRSNAIWLASLASAINFLFTFVGIYLVEKIGRRPLILGSLAGVLVGLVVLAVGFQVIARSSHPVVLYPSARNDTCYSHRTCDGCTLDKECGFCFLDPRSGPTNGSCVPVQHKERGVIDRAAFGPCHGPEPGAATWAYSFCPTRLSWIVTLGLALYLACFSSGMGPMPWTINAEIYPLWARSTGNAVATAVNWFFNLLVSLSFLSLMETLTRYGTFWFYSFLTMLGLLFIYLFLPETKGRTLEQTEHLFKASCLSTARRRLC